MRRLWIAAPCLVAVGLLAAGCGGGSSGGSGQSSGGSRTTTTQSSSGNGSARAAAEVKTSHLSLGTVLVGPTGRTLYLFEKDRRGASDCSGACAQGWPPLTTSGAPKARGSAAASKLGTIKRADGTMQVTYAGHPLYYYAGDQRAGQDNGEGSTLFGAGWYVVTPAGRKIDES